MTYSSPLQLKAIRGFQLGGYLKEIRGGTSAANPQTVRGFELGGGNNIGHCMVGQMYVQHFQQSMPFSPRPIYFWHGDGMTGSTWELTPDNRPGWHDYFMRQGYDTLLSDAVERGRSGWPPTSGTLANTPDVRTLEHAWDRFRLGARDAQGNWVAHELQQFPTECIQHFGRQFVPRWTTHRDHAILAYTDLLRQVGPGVVIAHGEGARLAQTVTQMMPQHVLALVLIEPTGGASLEFAQAAAIRDTPVCVIWGDHFDRSPLWQEHRASFDQWRQIVHSVGGEIDVIDLPALNILGNSHFPMMDKNNIQVATLVHAWIQRQLPVFAP